MAVNECQQDVYWEGHKDVVKLLLDEGADPNKADQEGETPLSMAKRKGKRDVIRLFLRRKPEDQQSDMGKTAKLE